MEESAEAPYDPAAAASASASAPGSFTNGSGVGGGGVGGGGGSGGGRGRGRGRGRGGGGIAIEGIAELDASLGRGAPPPPAGGGGKPLPPSKEGKDFRGPEGLFKKGDWNCNTCGNVNWERRQTCNKCQSQKPNAVTSDEAREGHGGGFNERQDRASVATVEVDEDGYDDFGRKKIKARADKKAKEMAALARLRKSFGGGLLGGTSLAPVGKPPVPGQFDDASPAASVTTYDEFGRPRLAGGGRGGSGSGNGNGNERSSSTGREREGRNKTGGDKGKDSDRDRDRDRRDRDKDRGRGGDKDRDRRRQKSRSRERTRDDKDRSRRRRSRSGSRERRR